MENEKKEVQCVAALEGKSSKVVIDTEYCDILKTVKKPPLFILGFAGAGMIGTIVTNELITQLKMIQIGYVLSEDLPPITIFYEGLLKHPFRLYYSKKHNFVVSICEVPFMQGSYSDLARTLMNWAILQGIEDIIVLQGMAVNAIVFDTPYPVYAAAEEPLLQKLLTHNVKIPPKGLIIGAEAAILNECLNNRLHGAVYLTPANPQIPAPEGAAAILEKLADVYGFPINLENLLTQGTEIKRSLLELAQKTEDVHGQGLLPAKDLYT
jgi:uncharacterized protein